MARNQDYERRGDDRFEGRNDVEARRYSERSGTEGRGDYGRGGNFERDREWRGQGNAMHGAWGSESREYGRADRDARERDEFYRDREFGRGERGRDEYGRSGAERGEFGRGERGRHEYGSGGRSVPNRPWGEGGPGRSWSDEGSFGSADETQRPWGQQGAMGWGLGSQGNPPGMTYGGTYGGTSPYGGMSGMGYYGTDYERDRSTPRGPGSPYGSQSSYGGYPSRQGQEYGESWSDSHRHHPHHEGFLERVGEKVGRFFGKGPKGYKRSDERIEEEVNEILFRDPHVDATDIEVDVNEGEVTLTGSVDDRQTKRMAEDCAWSVSGVRNVTNMIRVEVREYLRDDDWTTRRSPSMTPTSHGDEAKNKRQGPNATGAGPQKIGTSNT